MRWPRYAEAMASTRRDFLIQGASLGTWALSGCGGGGDAASSASGSSSGSSGSAGSTGTGSSTGSTTTTTTTTGTQATWPWASGATSTVARLPALSDFATVVASGTVTYSFHASAVSSTTDPVTGAVADTSTTAVLQPYRLSRTLVTNAQWKAFCNAMGSSYWPSTAGTAGQYWSGGAYPAGKEDHPVFFVSLTQARAFCAWLETQLPGYRFYVPTEGEWEYAALGTRSDWSYPWGSSAGIGYTGGTLTSPFNCNAVCAAYVLSSASGLSTLTYFNDTTVTTLSDGTTPLTNDTAALSQVLSIGSTGSVTGWQYDSDTNRSWADFANSDAFRELVNVYGGFSSAVGSYATGASWCGCLDMAGNAYEWTSTLNQAANGLEAGTMVNVVKGGSWYATASSGRSSGRGEGRSAGGSFHSVGFRVAARAV